MQRFDQHSDRNDKQIYDVPKVLYFHKRCKMRHLFRHFLSRKQWLPKSWNTQCWCSLLVKHTHKKAPFQSETPNLSSQLWCLLISNIQKNGWFSQLFKLHWDFRCFHVLMTSEDNQLFSHYIMFTHIYILSWYIYIYICYYYYYFYYYCPIIYIPFTIIYIVFYTVNTSTNSMSGVRRGVWPYNVRPPK